MDLEFGIFKPVMRMIFDISGAMITLAACSPVLHYRSFKFHRCLERHLTLQYFPLHSWAAGFCFRQDWSRQNGVLISMISLSLTLGLVGQVLPDNLLWKVLHFLLCTHRVWRIWRHSTKKSRSVRPDWIRICRRRNQYFISVAVVQSQCQCRA